jgi:hypothetical protein
MHATPHFFVNVRGLTRSSVPTIVGAKIGIATFAPLISLPIPVDRAYPTCREITPTTAFMSRQSTWGTLVLRQTIFITRTSTGGLRAMRLPVYRRTAQLRFNWVIGTDNIEERIIIFGMHVWREPSKHALTFTQREPN